MAEGEKKSLVDNYYDILGVSQTASGVYVARLMERLGIAEQLKDKTKRVSGVPVAEIVAKGEAEVGLQQINVILPVAGAASGAPSSARSSASLSTAGTVGASSGETCSAFAVTGISAARGISGRSGALG